MRKLKTIDMEIALMYHFRPRINLIIPNLSWAYFRHELDLAVLTPSNYLSEIEIKVSKHDLKKDKEKHHKHSDYRIKHLYFAVPEYLLPIEEHIPIYAGILSVNNNLRVNVIRKPKQLSTYRWPEVDRSNLLRLAAMRLTTQKKKERNLIYRLEWIKNGRKDDN